MPPRTCCLLIVLPKQNGNFFFNVKQGHITQSQTMPTTEQTPGKLGDAKVISKVYEKDGFWQRRLKDSLKFLPTRG